MIIKEEYINIRKKYPASICISMLMDKYSLSEEALNKILFRKRTLKKKGLLNQTLASALDPRSPVYSYLKNFT